MPTRERQRFINLQVAWTLSVVLGLSVLQILSFELFFLLSLIGFLVIIELTASLRLTPRWQRRLKWALVAGVIGFVLLLVRRVSLIIAARGGS